MRYRLKLQQPTEDQECTYLMDFVTRQRQARPEFWWLAKVANENCDELSRYRNARVGVNAGFPDYIWPIPSGDYAVLFLEMKTRDGGRVSEAQDRWRAHLLAQPRYAYVLALGWEAAADAMLTYLDRPGELVA